MTSRIWSTSVLPPGLTCTLLRALLSSPCGSPGYLSVGSLGHRSLLSLPPVPAVLSFNDLDSPHALNLLEWVPGVIWWTRLIADLARHSCAGSRHPQPDLRSASGSMEARREFALVLRTAVFSHISQLVCEFIFNNDCEIHNLLMIFFLVFYPVHSRNPITICEITLPKSSSRNPKSFA